MPPSVSSGFLHLVSTLSKTSRQQLAPSIKSCKLQYQESALLLPDPQAGKMSASTFMHYFSNHPAAFGV